MFKNRKQAGQLLAQALEKKQIEFDMVLGVPRGGVVLAEEIANHFSCPMDVIMAKKIGSPDLPDYAVGAVSPDGKILIHERVREIMNTDIESVEKLAERVTKNLNNRLRMFRNHKEALKLEGKKVLLVDDGIATGFTMKAAINYLKRQKANKINVAVPVSSKAAYLNLTDEVDDMLVLETPDGFYAVGQFYDDFAAVEDTEVIEILKQRKNQ